MTKIDLTDNKTPYAFLSSAEKAALELAEDAGETIMCYNFLNDLWQPKHVPQFDNSRVYRTVKQLIKPSICWAHVADEYRFLTSLQDGMGYLHRHEPEFSCGVWISGMSVSCDAFVSFRPGNGSNLENIVERPSTKGLDQVVEYTYFNDKIIETKVCFK